MRRVEKSFHFPLFLFFLTLLRFAAYQERKVLIAVAKDPHRVLRSDAGSVVLLSLWTKKVSCLDFPHYSPLPVMHLALMFRHKGVIDDVIRNSRASEITFTARFTGVTVPTRAGRILFQSLIAGFYCKCADDWNLVDTIFL
ncbi:hypothetical protein AVEN_31882-1 [Araneus ventricosus]|uniref:Secreted protein n=1 Tax=Araneus ventricosus TaxID=182803 RepID=A0A4Y2T5L8_ARAVE|nr:hypothetical protein AVEN_31882-1 [Araneus ventricosus]